MVSCLASLLIVDVHGFSISTSLHRVGLGRRVLLSVQHDHSSTLHCAAALPGGLSASRLLRNPRDPARRRRKGLRAVKSQDEGGGIKHLDRVTLHYVGTLKDGELSIHSFSRKANSGLQRPPKYAQSNPSNVRIVVQRNDFFEVCFMNMSLAPLLISWSEHRHRLCRTSVTIFAAPCQALCLTLPGSGRNHSHSRLVSERCLSFSFPLIAPSQYRQDNFI